MGNLGINLGYLIVWLVSFGIMMVVLRAWVYKPMLNMLEKRRNKISQGLEDARVAADARANAEREASKILADAQTKAAEIVREATGRAEVAVREVHAAADHHGRQAMVAFNLTGEVDEMRRRHDLVHQLGGTCVMVSLNSVGLTGLLALRRHSQLPIHAHRNGWGYLNRSPALGWDYAPWQVLWRLAGADHLHVNGLGNKFSEPDDSVIAAARAVLRPLDAAHPMAAMPVFSSGQTGLQAAPTYAALGTTDLIHAAGGGILGHPGGIQAGVLAMRQA